MQKRLKIWYEGRGPLLNNEEWIYLVVEEGSGQMHIEKGWSNVEPRPPWKGDGETTTLSVEDFLAGSDDEEHKATVRKLLAEMGTQNVT